MTKAQYFSWFDEVVKPTQAIFSRVPADKLDWKLTERSFTLGQLLRHIPGALGFFAMVMNNEQLPYKTLREIMVANRNHESSTVEEAILRLNECIAKFKSAVERLSEEQFQNEMLDTPQKGTVHYWRYCAFALEHHIHHLMELHLNLKALGVDVNTKSLYVG
jgi:uncharacterized damage-inducible protein DinB